MKRFGILAGNRHLPLLLIQSIKRQVKDCHITAVCFKGETTPLISRYADKVHWTEVGHLAELKTIIRQEDLREWFMAGQITPQRIFNRRNFDDQLIVLVERLGDLRPHVIFSRIIADLEAEGITFLDSTRYLKDCLAQKGLMDDVELSGQVSRDIDFGIKVISRFVDLDVGQTILVKSTSTVALEALEGTDSTILRGAKIAGKNCVVLKFSKTNQDLRFDVPVVGMKTLKLLRRIDAGALALEVNKVIILDKDLFLDTAGKWNIPVIGVEKC